MWERIIHGVKWKGSGNEGERYLEQINMVDLADFSEEVRYSSKGTLLLMAAGRIWMSNKQ